MTPCRPAVTLPLLLLGATLACYPPPASPSPESGADGAATMDTLPEGTEIRLVARRGEIRGRIVAVGPDSLRLRQDKRDTTLLRADIDSAWARRPRGYTGTKTGLAIGLVAGGLLVATPRGSEGTYYGWLLASRVAALCLGLGIAADVLSPARWIPIHPAEHAP